MNEQHCRRQIRGVWRITTYQARANIPFSASSQRVQISDAIESRMKAIFSKLKPKETSRAEGEEPTKENATKSRARKLAPGFSSLSRATGSKVFHHRQSSDSHDVGQGSSSTTAAGVRRPLSRLSLASNATSVHNGRSASVSTSSRGSRLESPIELGIASSTERISLSFNQDGRDSTKRISERPATSDGGYVKPLPPRPTRDIADAFGGLFQSPASGKPFSSLGDKTSRHPMSPDGPKPVRKQSVSSNLFHRRTSAQSTARNINASLQTSSTALSPVSTRSQESLASSEDKEYCKSRQSWTGMTDVDLVANLSVQERTRQEVLFEIVSSEERYVVTDDVVFTLG